MHSWFAYCINPDAFHDVRTLRKFIQTLTKQSNTAESLIPYRENLRLERYDEEVDGESTSKLKSPRYFGAGVEAFAETFFEQHGYEYNMQAYRSQDSVDEDLEDTGYDAIACTAKEKKYNFEIKKISKPGNHIYIQVKGTLNPNKEFMTNDGSRIMNFYGNAQGKARKMGEAYTARFMLFTTGKGLHHKLEKNTQSEIEVINYNMISKKIDNNPFFWNAFFSKLGLSEIPVAYPKDPEFVSVEHQLDNTVDN